MSRINLKIPLAYRRIFYTTLCLSWVTGLGFWLIRRFGEVEGDFGPQSHLLQYPLLQTHGLAAFVMLLCLGAIFASHIPATWRTGRQRWWGGALLAQVLLSLISAYSLYYLVSEQWHAVLGNSHALIGLLLPVSLSVHIYRARRTRKAQLL
jgi:hypothetical protein